jgi:membrane-associated HD superfamily phosphohydrolase
LAEQKELDEEIRHVLTEIRMVLPGAQALLGFQFIVMVLQEFEKLPEALKRTHLVSLSLMTLAVILLMTPAAYHRIVAKGENTSEFHQFAGRMLLASLIPLALGVASDFFIVVWKVLESYASAFWITGALLIFNFGLWFGWPAYLRARGAR